MPEPISTLAIAGLGCVIGGTIEGISDRTFSAVVRAMKDRVAGLRDAPESQDVARAVRIAQMQALERVIRDFREVARPERFSALFTRPINFFDQSLDFCARAIGRSRHLKVVLNLEVAPTLTAAIDGLLAPSIPSGPADQQAGAVAALAEDAVLEELSEALDGVRLPDGFQEHFRNGSRSKPRFLDLFAVYITEQIRENHGFRAVLNSVQLAHIESLVFDARELAVRIEERFGAALDHIESKVDAVGANVRQVGADLDRLGAQILAAVAADKGVPPEPLQAILERFGEEGVPLDQIPARLAAKADELLALREQWASLAQVNPDLVDVQRRALALIDEGDLAGARSHLSEARRQVGARRQDLLLQEAVLLASEAAIDRLELRYTEAAEKYREAARLVPFDQEAQFECLYQAAQALQLQGEEFGQNVALQRSIELYGEALGIVSRIDNPLAWGAVQNSLGTALASLGERDSDTHRMEEAIVTFHAALEERTRERVPLAWAMTQNNLGVTQSRIGERTGNKKWLEDAVESYRAAMEVRTRERVPLDWAMTQNNLGTVLLRLGERESGTERLLQAETAFNEALEERTRDRVPLDWAMTQNNLGGVLSIIGTRENRTDRLWEAVEAFRLVLEERTRDRVPLSWAESQVNLGSTLALLGERESSMELLKEALETLQAALTVRTKDRVPLNWAMTQGAVANVLAKLGEMEGSPERLEMAIATYREVLKQYTFDRVPLKWAMTLANLGGVLMKLGELESGMERLEEAVKAFGVALTVFGRGGADYYIGIAGAGLVRASQLLAQRVNQQRNG